MSNITQQELIRFNNGWELINKCHVWQKYLDQDGYGKFYLRKKNRRAHRVSFYISHGEIPADMVIDHTCKNRACVNVAHLRLATKTENVMKNSNSVGAVNSRKTTCKNGHALDRKYGIKKVQRYCSTCEREKSKRLRKAWLVEANKIAC